MRRLINSEVKLRKSEKTRELRGNSIQFQHCFPDEPANILHPVCRAGDFLNPY